MLVPNKNFDLIVFDWDGTLFDSTPTIVACIQAACRDLGLKVPDDEQAAYVIGLGIEDSMRHIVPDLAPSDWQKMGERFRYHYLTQDEKLVLFKGVPEMLHSLKDAGHFLAIATGKPRRGLNRALGAVGLDNFFDYTRCADETRGKPHPQMLEEIFRASAILPTCAVMVGDTTHDLQLAANAGCAAIAVNYGAHNQAALLAHQPLVCVNTVFELQQYLVQHG